MAPTSPTDTSELLATFSGVDEFCKRYFVSGA
jgi:hypothetical protein